MGGVITGSLGGPENQHDEYSYLKNKVERYKNKLSCSICKMQEKQVILPCYHMFCEDCITKNIETRQRMCPLDRKKIGKNDVNRIYWGDDMDTSN